MKKKEIIKYLWCTVFHQDEWKKYVVGIDPHITLAVCSKCGSSHVAHRGFTTKEDTERKIDKILKRLS